MIQYFSQMQRDVIQLKFSQIRNVSTLTSESEYDLLTACEEKSTEKEYHFFFIYYWDHEHPLQLRTTSDVSSSTTII